MEEHWKGVQDLFSILSYFVKCADPDGAEVYFTVSLDRHSSKRTSSLLDILKQKTPAGVSDISLRLKIILGEYGKMLHHAMPRRNLFRMPKSAQPLSLYVLTDAVWQPNSDAETPIREVTQTLQLLQLPLGQVAIHFLRFGNDPIGVQRLEDLTSM
jgi:hypothetical protein